MSIAKDLSFPRSPNVTAYLWQKFLAAFRDGCELWTSEDGMLTALAVVRREDAGEVLVSKFACRLTHEKPITLVRLKPRYATREWAGADFFDGGGCEPARGKIWRLCDDPTPFPVYEYEMEHPL